MSLAMFLATMVVAALVATIAGLVVLSGVVAWIELKGEREVSE